MTVIYSEKRFLKIIRGSQISFTAVGDIFTVSYTHLDGDKRQEYVVEGDLRREVSLNSKRLMEIGSDRGIRHRRGLPVRGQKMCIRDSLIRARVSSMLTKLSAEKKAKPALNKRKE